MSQKLGRFVVVRFLLLFVVLILVRPDAVQARHRPTVRKADRDFFYARNITQRRALNYVMTFTERMSFAGIQFRADLASEIESQRQIRSCKLSVEGYAAYLVSGPIPSVEFLSLLQRQ